MMDEKTKNWWQQVSGKAILGSLKGTQLEPVFHDELSFGTWKRENRRGRVLMPDSDARLKNVYAKADWETRVGKYPVKSPYFQQKSISARTIVIGLDLSGVSRAYPVSLLPASTALHDTLHGNSIVLITDQDGRSIRCFSTEVEGTRLEFFTKSGNPARWFDSQTGSEWNFSGKAISGKLQGTHLKKIPILKDYWFDWQTYHPGTTFYKK